MTEKPIDPLLIKLIKLFKPYQILIISALYISTIAYIFIVTISNQYYLSLGVDPAIFQYSIIDYFTNSLAFLTPTIALLIYGSAMIFLFIALIYDTIFKLKNKHKFLIFLNSHPKINALVFYTFSILSLWLLYYYPVYASPLPLVIALVASITPQNNTNSSNNPGLTLFSRIMPFFIALLILAYLILVVSAVAITISTADSQKTKEHVYEKAENYKSHLVKIKESNQEVYKLGCGPEFCAGLIAPNDPEGNIESIIFSVKSYSKTLPK